MAVNLVPGEVTWIQNWTTAVNQLKAQMDFMNGMATDYAANGYGSGGANAITDATVQSGNASGNGPLPGCTALQLAESVGAFVGANAVYATFQANRGYFLNLK